MEQFFINTDTMTAIKEVPEDAEGKFAVVTKADELVDQFDKKQLQVLIGGIRGKELKGDESKSAKKLAFECFKMLVEPPKEKTAPAEKKPPKVTKVSIARQVLADKKVILKKDLAEAVGHDLANCHTMISILKNPARTKEPLFVAYNKKTTEYTLCETKEAMVEIEAGFVKAIEDAKAEEEAAKKAAADKKAADKAAAKEETTKEETPEA